MRLTRGCIVITFHNYSGSFLGGPGPWETRKLLILLWYFQPTGLPFQRGQNGNEIGR